MPGNYFDKYDGDPGFQPPAPQQQSVGGIPVTQAPMPAPPPGVINPAAWQQEMATQAAKDSGEALTKAEGARESLLAIKNLKSMINDAPEASFGPFMGGELANRIHSFGGAIPGDSLLSGGPSSPSSGELSEWHDRLKGAYGALQAAKIKETFGNMPRGGGGGSLNPLIENAMANIGGTTVSNKKTALQVLDDASVKSWDQIYDGIKRGRVNPSEYLSSPKSQEESDALGRGALWLDPKGNIRRNKI